MKYLSNNDISFSLSISNNLSFLRLVQSFIEEASKMAGFGESETVRFNLIAEEAFVHILKTSFEKEESGLIKLLINITETNLIISFIDKGMPLIHKKQDNIELAILKHNCKRIEWINLGKNGKELRLTFQRPKKDITQYKLPFSQQAITPSDSIIIRKMESGEEYQISQIVYKVYGYTYPSQDLYYPDIIKKLNDEGKLLSIVAFDEKNKIVVGHYALELTYGKFLAETGQALVMPTYRNKGLLYKMREKLEEEAKLLNLKGIFSQPVTSHIKTQKANEQFGSKVCGVSFGLVPSQLNFKNMNIQQLSQRESCIVYFKKLSSEKHTIFSCFKHTEIVKSIYKNLGLSFEIKRSRPINTKTQLHTKYYGSWGFGTINIENAGSNFNSKFKETFNKLRLTTRPEIIFANLAMNGNIDEAIEFMESVGFFFVGILPYGFNGFDIIRFEYLNTPIDTSKINIYADFAKELVEYCSNMMKKALS